MEPSLRWLSPRREGQVAPWRSSQEPSTGVCTFTQTKAGSQGPSTGPWGLVPPRRVFGVMGGEG